MKKISAWLPVALWMGVIFTMSAMPGEISSAQSGAVVDILTAVYSALSGGRHLAPWGLKTLAFLVRKAAHMGEYAVLAALSARAFFLSGAKRPFVSAFLLSTLFAAGDEFHQAFVPGRGPSPTDVAIDAAGAALGLVLAGICLIALHLRGSRIDRA